MNKELIRNWNTFITNKDEIYILGDFMYKCSGTEAEDLVKKLNGKKIFDKR
jgi:calcineurin-like phosphoesterase family protein